MFQKIISNILQFFYNLYFHIYYFFCYTENKFILSIIEPSPAFESLLMEAEKGNPQSQYKIGLMYAQGQSVPPNDIEAVKWISKAAEQGSAAAQCNLGLRYCKGEGVPQDNAMASQWFEKAGKVFASSTGYHSGNWYDEKGVPRKYSDAVKWLRQAAEFGNAQAQYQFGFMHQLGHGVLLDRKKSLKWILKAADQGHKDAQRSLASIYHLNIVPKDNVQAYMWLYLSIQDAIKGDFLGERIAKEMTLEEINKAVNLAKSRLKNSKLL